MPTYCACGREQPSPTKKHTGPHRGSQERRGGLRTYEAQEHLMTERRRRDTAAEAAKKRRRP
jgi:hypothetical protein